MNKKPLIIVFKNPKVFIYQNGHLEELVVEKEAICYGCESTFIANSERLEDLRILSNKKPIKVIHKEMKVLIYEDNNSIPWKLNESGRIIFPNTHTEKNLEDLKNRYHIGR